MSDTCKNCEFREKCKELGYDMSEEDVDECGHYYAFSEEE